MVDAQQSEEQEVGRVTDYFAHIGVAGIDLTAPLRVGDRIRIKGHTTDLEQAVDSIQIEHESVQEAKPGDKVIICNYAVVNQQELANFKPTLVYLDENNKITHCRDSIPRQVA